MSTVTVAKKNGYIAIAADSLIKWGSEKNSAKHVVNHNKILRLGENYLAITGPAAGQLALQHYFSRLKTDIRLRNIEEIFHRFNGLHQALKESYHLETKDESEAAFESSHMDILIANPYGIFAVGAHRDVQEFAHFYAYGAGNEYALGAMYVAYNDSDKSAEDIARIGVEASAEFDDSTGLPVVSYVFKQHIG